MLTTYTSVKTGSCSFRTLETIESTHLYAIATTEWELLGQAVPLPTGQLEWNWVRSDGDDFLHLKNEPFSLMAIIMLQNSARFHITGNGHQILHEAGVGLLYSPFMSYTIELNKQQVYSWLTVRYNSILNLPHTADLSFITAEVHPRKPLHLLATPKIFPTKQAQHLWPIETLHTTTAAPTYHYTPQRYEDIAATLNNVLLFDDQSEYLSIDSARHLYKEKNAVLSACLSTASIETLLSTHTQNSKLFSEGIKSIYGCNARELINQYRIQIAAAMLRTSDYPIKEIARMVGFKNVFHFTRRFTKYYRMPPRRYQEWCKKQNR